MTLPVYGGASAAKAEGTTTVSPGIPSGVAAGDLMLAILAGSNTGAWSVAAQGTNGSWTNIGQAEVGTTTTTANIQVFSDYFTAGQTAPTFNTPGNNGVGRIIYITGARSADEAGPFGGMSADLSDSSGDTACSLVSGLTTSDADCLIVLAAAAADDSPTFGATWSDANLGSVTTRLHDTTINGNDSTCDVVTGTLATAGAVGTFSNTLTGAVNVAGLVIAIRPPAGSTTPQALNITATYTPTLVRQANKVLAVGVTYGLSFLKQVNHALTVSATYTPTLLKQVNHALALGATYTTSLLKQVNHALAVSPVYTPALTMMKVLLKDLAIGVTYGVSMTKAVSHALSVGATYAASLATQFISGSTTFFKSLAVGVTYTPTLATVFQKAAQEVQDLFLHVYHSGTQWMHHSRSTRRW